jgi:hypothetical protein
LTPLFKKLNLGTHTAILVLNAPESFNGELAQLTGVTVHRSPTLKSPLAFGIGFAMTRAELDELSKTFVSCLQGDAIVWVAYPKKSSKRYQCEFDRDSGWKLLGEAGFEPVRQVAIDDDWSGLRFRRAEHIKSLTRSSEMAISKEGKRRSKR